MLRIRLLFVALALVGVFATALLVVHPSTAHAQTRAATQQTVQFTHDNPSLCYRSWGFVARWGYGAYISHCDLQSLNSWSDYVSLAGNVLSYRYNPGVAVLASALWAYKTYLMNNVDHGNGIYIGWPWVGGLWVWSA